VAAQEAQHSELQAEQEEVLLQALPTCLR